VAATFAATAFLVLLVANLSLGDKHIDENVATLYTVGDAQFRTLVAAAKRGVRVQLIAPGKKTDSPAVRRASRSTWDELLRAGVEIYEYQPTFFHCKVMIVDDLWVSVGSTSPPHRPASSPTTSSAQGASLSSQL
jgi:cardiolipin synthase